jgi:hypothetical protein
LLLNVFPVFFLKQAATVFALTTKTKDTKMTYLDWGCDPLAAECESCLNALCNACDEESRKKPCPNEDCHTTDRDTPDFDEPDCDRCEVEKKPDCLHCTIILEVCLTCADNKTCEFRISGE